MAVQGIAGGIPVGTVLFGLLCLSTYVLQSAFSLNTGRLAIGAFPIVFLGEWYRVVTSAFLHGGLMHIGMNMMTLFAMGPSVEGILGTVTFVLLIVATVLLEGLLYVGMCMVGWAATGDPSWLHTYAVGFSGVLFMLAVEEASLSPRPTRSVFGLFSVPTRLYPWVLLVLMQVVMPNISFFGHLAGLLVGVLHVGRALSWILPSHETARQLERWGPVRRLSAAGGIAPTPTLDPISVAAERVGAAGGCAGTLTLAFSALWDGLGPILVWLWSGLAAILTGLGAGACVAAAERGASAVTGAVRACCACACVRRGGTGGEPPRAQAAPEQAARAAVPVPIPGPSAGLVLGGRSGAPGATDGAFGGRAPGELGADSDAERGEARGSASGDAEDAQLLDTENAQRSWGGGTIGGGRPSAGSRLSAAEAREARAKRLDAIRSSSRRQ